MVWWHSRCYRVAMRFPWRSVLQAVAGVAVGTWLTGCDCECEEGILLELPNLDPTSSGPVRVTWRRSADEEPRVVCSWVSPGAEESSWSCTPAAESAVGNYYDIRFRYEDPAPEANWEVTLEGPSGSLTKTVTTFSTDPGEGWPTQCSCYDYSAEIAKADLESVGAKIKP